MKHKITMTKEIEIEQDMIIELRHGDKQLWNLGTIISIVDIKSNMGTEFPEEEVLTGTFLIIRVYGFADHAYNLFDLKIDNDGTPYFYEGE